MKKGFTLVELISVIALVALVFILVIPGISSLINNKKDDISSTMNEVLYNSAKLYMSNDNIYPILNENVYCIKLESLIDKEYLTNPIIDPVNQNEISKDKYVKVSVMDNRYNYSISNECEEFRYGSGSGDLYVTVTPSRESNENGWYNSDLDVIMEVYGGNKFRFCVTTEDECLPTNPVDSSREIISIGEEGINTVCAQGISATLGKSEVVCNSFNFDMTPPTFVIDAKPYFYGDNWSDDWGYNLMVGGNLVDNLSLVDYSSLESIPNSYDIYSIDESIDELETLRNFYVYVLISSSQDTVTLRASDLAGNMAEIEITDFEKIDTGGNEESSGDDFGGLNLDGIYTCPEGYTKEEGRYVEDVCSFEYSNGATIVTWCDNENEHGGASKKEEPDAYYYVCTPN